MKRSAGLLVFSLFLLNLCFSADLTIRNELINNDTYQFYGSNPAIIPQYLVLDFPSLTNLEPSSPLPYRVVLPPGAVDVPLLKLTAKKSGSIGFRSSYTFTQGDPSAVHDKETLYLFPFAHGTKHQLTQGNKGAFTHFDDNTYAFDFDLKEGTPVHAARAGMVVEIKEDSNRGGNSSAYNEYGNYVLVYHADGSFGNYVHLKQNGALVDIGQMVEAGDLIGLSGNTGRSSGPHLHFDVRLPNQKGRMESIPVSFLHWDGSRIVPKEGDFYYALHPGKETFTVSFGTDLVNADFANYQKVLTKAGKVDIRSEEIDSTYILYALNPTDSPIELNYSLKLTNFRSSRPNPETIQVPAMTEVFMCILQPVPGTVGGGYQISYSIKKR